MVVGAKRGSAVQYMKYPIFIPAYYIQWFLQNPKASLGYILIVRLQRHVDDRYNVRVWDYRLTVYKKNLVSNSIAQISSSFSIPKKEARFVISNFRDAEFCQKWFTEKFGYNERLKSIFEFWKIFKRNKLSPPRSNK